MVKKYQVFISSTYEDLIRERQRAITAILNAEQIPAGMEAFKTGDASQKEVISKWIQQSDIYLLILGGRYGSKDEQDGISYTEWEYLKAGELNIPRFAIVLKDEYINENLDASHSEQALPEYQQFKEKVTKNHLVSFVNSLDQLELEIMKNLPEIIKDHEESLKGWVPGHYQRDYENLRDKQNDVSDEIRQNNQDILKMVKQNSGWKDDYIGQYHFSYIKKKLEETIIPQDEFNKDLKSTIDSYKSSGKSKEDLERAINKIENQKNGQRERLPNLLEYVKVNKRELVGPGLNIMQRGLIEEYYVSELEQLNLAKEETIKKSTHFPNGQIVDFSYDSLYFTEEGKKFMTMLDELNSSD
ncbi:DUF4062 domain-containing protein [Lactiplantibacillus paraplantarum]|uniref:DUF4062 domain-containing protein n=1 Tax=Lactiplantibacillus paraplantarum TaxID=60520 RepID=UPI0023AA7A83|nr:DUF4062 domain-containing protein [Lactiplantibacillus paraplantarum]WEE36051.1 DUF4062 domain-containing protein [Lactiplantibacillus paraplantarum]